MLNLLKNFARHKVAVIIALVLLIGQAYCELALPSYTSDIVDTGIQYYGVENSAAKYLSEDTYNNLELFMLKNEKKTYESSYKKNSKGLYELKLTDDKKIDNLADIMKMPFIANYMLGKMGGVLPEKISAKDAAVTVQTQMGTTELSTFLLACYTKNEDGSYTLDKKANDTIKKSLSMVIMAAMQNGADISYAPSLEQISAMLSQMDEKTKKEYFDNFDDMIIKKCGGETFVGQVSIQAVLSEYDKAGVDKNELQTDYLWSIGLRMVIMTILMMATGIGTGYIASRVAAEIGYELRGMTFRRVVSFSNGEMDKFSTASLVTRSTNDIQQIQFVSMMLLRMVLYAPILGVGGVIKVADTHTGMGWVIGVAVGIVLLIVGILMSITMPKFKKVQILVDKLNLVSREILTGVPVIRAFSREKYEEKRFDEANTNLTKTQLFTSRVMSLMMPLMMLLMNGIAILVVWVGGNRINSGNMQVGDMMAFITYTMVIVMAFLMISMMSIMLPRAAVSANRIAEVVKTEPKIVDNKNVKDLSLPKKGGKISFNHVNFKYDGAEEDALHDISFVAEPGKTTAIIGGTGCGKSTLINLIPRFYDVTGGEVTYDGINVKDISQQKLREKIGFVPQKGVLFSGTIASNLKFGGENITDEDIRKAAEIAQAKGFIEEKSEGYDNEIAQGGTNVSGGQKQRISIARAIAKHPDVFIFDDSFSALDFKTDADLRKALKETTGDATVIIVAQRISTILHADNIIVLDEGKIAGQGTHNELLSSCPEYLEIASSQLSEEELKGGKE